MSLSLMNPAFAPPKDLLKFLVSGRVSARRKTAPAVGLFMGRLTYDVAGRHQELEAVVEDLMKSLSRVEAVRADEAATASCRLEDLTLMQYEPSQTLVARYLDESKQAGGSLLQRLISMPRITEEDASATMVQAVLGALSYFVAKRVDPKAGVVKLDDKQLEVLLSLIADRLGTVGSSNSGQARAFASAVMHDVLRQLHACSGALELGSGLAAAREQGTFVVQRKGASQTAQVAEDNRFRLAA